MNQLCKWVLIFTIGFSPFAFTIEIYGQQPIVQPLPQVVSNVNAIQIIAVREQIQNSKEDILTLHNVSNKNIVSIYISRNDGVTGFFWGQRLISAGGVKELAVLSPIFLPFPQKSSTDKPLPRWTVGTVVFDDYSYEGELNESLHFPAKHFGLQVQLRHVIHWLDELQLGSVTNKELINNLMKSLEEFPTEVDTKLLAEFSRKFPSIKITKENEETINNRLEDGLTEGKATILDFFRDEKNNLDSNELRARLLDLNRLPDQDREMVLPCNGGLDWPQ